MSQTIAQKMTDHEFTASIDGKVAREMTSSALTFATDEAIRARSEEARLLEENRKQAETIKALADALENAKRRLAAPENATIRDRMDIDAALRLAGRLP